MTEASQSPASESPAEVIRRWEASGGHWRVLARSDVTVEVGLFSCDAGEEMHRVSGPTAELAVLLGGRTRSDD